MPSDEERAAFKRAELHRGHWCAECVAEAVAAERARIDDDLTTAYMVGYENGKDFAILHARAVHGCEHGQETK